MSAIVLVLILPLTAVSSDPMGEKFPVSDVALRNQLYKTSTELHCVEGENLLGFCYFIVMKNVEIMNWNNDINL